MAKVIYITGNKFKVLTTKKILEPLNIEVEAQKIKCPEIQAD
jgi:inosine/xanthosine triphosphate pyrophosphatase family protein